MFKVRGVRGATTVAINSKTEILDATKELLQKLKELNSIDTSDIAAVFFTTTRDINAEFPAVAARHIGWTQVALMCGHDMDVPDAQPRCIRVLVLLNTEKSQSDIQNVYLREAVNLRSRGINDN